MSINSVRGSNKAALSPEARFERTFFIYKRATKCISSEEQVAIIYHADCIDGMTAAYIALKGVLASGGSLANITLIPAAYGKVKEIITDLVKSEVSRVYIVDFSLALHDLEKLNRAGIRNTTLDHHVSAITKHFQDVSRESLTGRNLYLTTSGGSELYFDTRECGASMVYKYFFEVGVQGMPDMINYAKDYDLWKFTLPHTKALNAYLRTLTKDCNAWRAAAIIIQYYVQEALTIGNKALAEHDAKVLKAVEHAIPCRIAGKRGFAVNCDAELASDVGHKLAELSGTYGATYMLDKTGVSLSLRSVKDYDVSLLAARFVLGGGHKNAAGARCAGMRYKGYEIVFYTEVDNDSEL